MSEKHVIDPNHLEQINQLRESSTDLIYRLGQIEMELIVTEKQLLELKKAKEAAITEYDKLQHSETELVKILTDQYGTGTLNIESGEFIAS